MERKTCNICRAAKPLSAFYRNPLTRDGYVGSCKCCISKKTKAARAENLDETRRRDREKYARSPKRQAYAKDYVRKHASIEKRRIYRARATARHPSHSAATSLVYSEIQHGRMTRPATCSECGCTGNIQGHHDDYSKPKVVRWLCTKCHGLVHRKGY